MRSFRVFHEKERTRWTLKDIPWERLEASEVPRTYVMLAKSAVMGESNSIAAVHGFLNEFMDDYDFSAFVSLWGYEELQHHYAFRTWLEHCGETIDDERVFAMREPYPPGITPTATLVTNLISEITACRVYHHMASHVTEPVLSLIFRNASRDEAIHAREFGYYARGRLERYPAELQSVLETLFVYTADINRQLKHPVSVFKGDLSELKQHETIDDGLYYFAELSQNTVENIRHQIYATFSRLTGLTLKTPSDVRRQLRKMIATQRKG